jgi:penicillin G amidase
MKMKVTFIFFKEAQATFEAWLGRLRRSVRRPVAQLDSAREVPAVRGRSTRRSVARGALIGLVLVAAGVTVVLRGSLPQLSGRVAVPGISRPIEIERDRSGIPHIYAESDLDAYFGLGYAHAQDRLWQMEMSRRAGSGTLSEVFGTKTLENDRFFRTLGIRRAAAENVEHLDAKTRDILKAYAEGVNAYLRGAWILPPEFLFFRHKPAPWAPVDSLVWLKMMAWSLSGNLWDELLNVRLRHRLTQQDAEDLLPPYPGDEARWPPDLDAVVGPLDAAAAALLESAPGGATPGVGSNAWVVDGTRTESGKPLLANDPHLMLSAPSVWYFAHLHAPGLNVIGATLPGLPTVILGRNDRVAWGYTNTRPDTQDLFVEKTLPGDPSRYSTPEGPRAFDTVHEIIQVKGAPEEELRVRVSRHGPVISDVYPAVRAAMPMDTVLALGWVGLRADDLTLQFTVKAATAGTGDDLSRAACDFHSPQQSIVYADVDGEIGFVAAGRVPVRRADNDTLGLIPVPGWLERYDWTGFIPCEELPRDAGKSSGKLVTANQKITPDGYRYWMNGAWAPPYRAHRISALLDATARHTVPDFMRIQTDVKDPTAEELLPRLLQIEPEDAEQAAILERMRRWDAEMARDRPEPLIFAEWVRQLSGLMYRGKLGDFADEVSDYNPRFLVKVLTDTSTQARWCPEEPAGEANRCAGRVRRALALALERLDAAYGRDPSKWSWGAAHTATFTHQTLGRLPLLSRLLNPRTASSGGQETVSVSAYYYDEVDAAYVTASAPSFRAIYDFSDLERSVYVLSPGQSGHPLSPLYKDMIAPWSEGLYVPMVTERSVIAKSSSGTLTLLPR